jgi:hypothetical protein
MFSTGGVGIAILSSHGFVSLPQAAPTPAEEALTGSPAYKKLRADSERTAGQSEASDKAADDKKASGDSDKQAAPNRDSKKATDKDDEEEAAVKTPVKDETPSGGEPSSTPPAAPTPPAVTPEEDVADTATVTFDGTGFDIANAMVDLGGTLTFVNAGSSELLLACTDAAAADRCTGTAIAPGASWSVKPDAAGTWNFKDQANPATAGTLTVY